MTFINKYGRVAVNKQFSSLHISVAVIYYALSGVAISQQESPPVVINQETGEQVPLVRAHWNANVDIGGREIQCDHFELNQGSSTYEPFSFYGSPWGFFLDDSPYFHHPIANMPPFVSVLEHVTASFQRPAWSVLDGVYNGLAPFNYSPFLELVSYDADRQEVISTTDANAIRIWYGDEYVDASIHSVCYALDNEPFTPTGSTEVGNTDLVEPVESTFQFPDAIAAGVELPVVYRKDTGVRIEFVRGEWNYNEQLAMKDLHCGPFRWDGRSYVATDRGGSGVAYSSYFYPHIGDGFVRETTQMDDAVPPSTSSRPINAFRPSSRWTPDNEWLMELTDSGYNLWRSGITDADYYMRCLVENFEPKRLLPVQPENCDYTNASEYDGWGWNSEAQIPCPPIEGGGLAVNETGGTANPVTETPIGDPNVSDDLGSGSNNSVETSNDPNDQSDPASNAVESNSVENDPQQSNSSGEGSGTNSSAVESGGGGIGVLVLVGLFCFGFMRVPRI